MNPPIAPAALDRPQLPLPVRLADLPATAAAAETPWLWHGLLAPGQLTLLSSQSKSGKTTLLTALLGRMKEGGLLAGRQVRPGRALVISEEELDHWFRRNQQIAIAEHVHLNCKVFRGRKPSVAAWLALLDQIRHCRAEHGIDLAVIDTLLPHLPCRSENDSATLLEALTPLEDLTAAGLSVLLLHHCRKNQTLDGQAARGSSALPAFVDIHVEMHWYGRSVDSDRRRKLVAHSRHPETPRQLIIELQPDGLDYLVHGDFEEDALTHGLQVLLAALEPARTKLTRPEILAAWPADHAKPSEKTLWRWLDRAVERGLLRADGAGHSNDPFYYWLPSLEALWETDVMAKFAQEMCDSKRKFPLPFPLTPLRKPRR